MFFQSKKLMNARQANQKHIDAQMDYFAIRFAIRNGDKNTAAMVDSYAKHYASIAGENLTWLRSYLNEAQS